MFELALALYLGSIQEDDPRWDCSVMGNLVCGPEHNPESAWAAWDEQDAADQLPDRFTRVEYAAESQIPFLLLSRADADDILVTTYTTHYLFEVK